MNKFLLTTLGLVAVLSVNAQGVFNASNNFTPEGATRAAFVYDLDGETALAKASGRVQIINAASGETLSPGGAEGVAFALDGRFFVNGLEVPGTPAGGSADIIVRAWDSTTGATWDNALSRAEGLITVTGLGGGPTPPATFAQNSNFVGLQLELVPEPSTIALAALGVAGLFFVARRKN